MEKLLAQFSTARETLRTILEADERGVPWDAETLWKLSDELEVFAVSLKEVSSRTHTSEREIEEVADALSEPSTYVEDQWPHHLLNKLLPRYRAYEQERGAQDAE